MIDRDSLRLLDKTQALKFDGVSLEITWLYFKNKTQRLVECKICSMIHRWYNTETLGNQHVECLNENPI